MSNRIDNFGAGRTSQDVPKPVPTPAPAGRSISDYQRPKTDESLVSGAVELGHGVAKAGKVFKDYVSDPSFNLLQSWGQGVARLGQAALSPSGLVDNPYDVKDSSGKVTGTRYGQMGWDVASVLPYGKIMGGVTKGAKYVGEASGVVPKAKEIIKYNPKKTVVPNVGPKSIPNSGSHIDVGDAIPSKSELSRYQRAKSTVGAKLAPAAIAAGSMLGPVTEFAPKVGTSISRVEGAAIKGAEGPAGRITAEIPKTAPKTATPRITHGDTASFNLPDGAPSVSAAKAAAAKHAAEVAAKAAAASQSASVAVAPATQQAPTTQNQVSNAPNDNTTTGEQPAKPAEENPTKPKPNVDDGGIPTGSQDVTIPRLY